MKFTSHSGPASATVVGGRQMAFEDGFREAVRRHFLSFVIPDLIRDRFFQRRANSPRIESGVTKQDKLLPVAQRWGGGSAKH